MNRSIVLTCVLFFAGHSAGQITAKYVAGTDLTVSTLDSKAGSTRQTILQGTDLKTNPTLSTKNVAARASLRCALTQKRGSVSALIQASGSAWNNTYRFHISAADAGPHETLLTVHSATPIQAVARISWGQSGSTGVSSVLSVDLGNDGKWNIPWAVMQFSKDFPITIDNRGYSIRSRTVGKVSANGGTPRSFSYGLNVEILPRQDCQIAKQSNSCGLFLDGENLFGGRIGFDVFGAPSRSPGLAVFGNTWASVPLPGTSCRLLVQPLALVPISFDVAGNLSWNPAIPKVRPITVLLQVGSLSAPITTSNTLLVDCK